MGTDIVLLEKVYDEWYCKQLLYGFTNESMIINAMANRIEEMEEELRLIYCNDPSSY